MKKFGIDLTISLIAVIICFIIGEAILRVFYNQFSNYNLEMWRYACELKKPLTNDKLPFHHFPNSQGKYYGVDIKTNSMGFRDYEYALEKPSGKKRVLFLGDSFTLGWGVPLDSLYSKQLEQMLNEDYNKIEVINAGVGNYNSIMEVELFKLKGLELNPDLVILMYFINDVEPTPEKISSFGYFIRTKFYLYGFLFDRFLKIKTLFVDDFSWRKYYTNLYSSDSEAVPENYKSLVELCRICKRNGIKLLIVNIPELRELNKYPFPFATEYIKNLADNNEVEFLDLLPFLQNYYLPSLWISNEDPHASPKANTLIAKVLHKKLREKGKDWF